MWSVMAEFLSHMVFLVLSVVNGNAFPKPLSAKEERQALAAMAQGDRAARTRLIEHNLRLVAHIIKKHYAAARDQEDLVSIGTIGLIKAVNTFRPDRQIKLATYASRCIENEILMFLRKNAGIKTELSLDEPLNVDYDGNELLLSDMLGTEVDEVCKELEVKEEKSMVRKALACLSPREKTIIELRFGLAPGSDGKEKTQKEVADLLGISQSYISRLEKKTMERLKELLRRI